MEHVEAGIILLLFFWSSNIHKIWQLNTNVLFYCSLSQKFKVVMLSLETIIEWKEILVPFELLLLGGTTS